MSSGMSPERPRSGAPRPMREILRLDVAALTTSDQARAYGAWERASSAPVSSNARPSGFFNGVLTIECVSSVWVNELTYLSVQILARMNEVAPGQPVRRLRFVLERAEWLRADSGAFTAEGCAARRQLSQAALSGAREAARSVSDERLRLAIEAALSSSSNDR